MKQGFTLIEVLISVTIFVVIAAGGFLLITPSQHTISRSQVTSVIFQPLQSARASSLVGEGTLPWGVYFDFNESTRLLSQVTIFQGNDYATRTTTEDIDIRVNPQLLIISSELSGAAVSGGNDHEIVFTQFSGTTDGYGSIVVDVRDEVVSVTITQEGFVYEER